MDGKSFAFTFILIFFSFYFWRRSSLYGTVGCQKIAATQKSVLVHVSATLLPGSTEKKSNLHDSIMQKKKGSHSLQKYGALSRLNANPTFKVFAA